MCIIYDHAKTELLRARKSGALIVYKIYQVYEPGCLNRLGKKRLLMSPYKKSIKGGVLTRAGARLAFNQWGKGNIGIETPSALPIITPERLYKYSGHAIMAWGFHCFLTHQGAKNYAQATGLESQHVIVPLKVELKDLIVAGDEDGYPTATFKRIHISPTAWKRAFRKQVA